MLPSPIGVESLVCVGLSDGAGSVGAAGSEVVEVVDVVEEVEVSVAGGSETVVVSVVVVS